MPSWSQLDGPIEFLVNMTEGRSVNLRRATAFAILFIFWLAFSGHFDSLHLGLGIVCCLFVASLSYDLLIPTAPSSLWFVRIWRLCLYTPWLLYEIVLANFHVVYLVFRPGQIRPQVVRFHTRLTSDLARVALGNSITLTPGTITLDIQEKGEFHVHALSDKAAQSVIAGDMERRIGQAFLEPSEEPVNN